VVSNTLCFGFILIVFHFCTLCCQFIWFVHYFTICVAWQVSFKIQELLTLREYLGSPPCFWWAVLLNFLCCALFFFVLCLLYLMLPVSLDCSFLIVPSVSLVFVNNGWHTLLLLRHIPPFRILTIMFRCERDKQSSTNAC
jgi:hypothetical protein